MKRKVDGYALLFLLLVIPLAEVPLLASEAAFSVTAYSNNTALIRQVQNETFKKGVSEFRLAGVAALIEPASVQIRSLTSPEALRLLEQRFEFDLGDTGRLLQKYIGRNIQVTVRGGETYAGTLLRQSAGDLMLELADRSLRVVKSGALAGLLLPDLPDGLRRKPALAWRIQCDKPGDYQIETHYLTGGLQWSARYLATLNPEGNRVRLLAWASIDNHSGVGFPEAQINLVAGDVRRESPPPFFRSRDASLEVAQMAKKAGTGFSETPLFEYHLYRLDRKTTLADGESVQIPLFAPSQVQAKKEFSYDGQADQERVRVVLVFQNRKDAGLGIPLPGGRVQVYQAGKDGSLIFTGEDEVAHTPEGEEARLSLGTAFDLVGERTVLETRQVGKRSRQETVEVQLRNLKDIPVSITVIERLAGNWEFVGPTPPVRKKQATRVEFEIKVPPKGKEILQYTVQYNW